MIHEERRFRDAVTGSWRAVWAVARYIHAMGDRAVKIEPLRLRPSFDQRVDYGDEFDLQVQRAGGEWRSIEVKWRGLDFTDAVSFPFATVFVDRCDKADGKNPPVGYFMVNRAATHAAWVNAKSSRGKWIGPTTRQDKIKGYAVTVYECPKEVVRFVAL